MERRMFSQTMAFVWQTTFVISHKMPWCALLTAVKNYNKSWKNCKTFSSRPRPRTNVQDQDFMIQDQDFNFCPRGASRPRPWSGLEDYITSCLSQDDAMVCLVHCRQELQQKSLKTARLSSIRPN